VPPDLLHSIPGSPVPPFPVGGGGGDHTAHEEAKGNVGEGCGGGKRRVYLAHDEERNLHVTVFGWARFRQQDIAFITPYAPFIEMGAGSGWLGKF